MPNMSKETERTGREPQEYIHVRVPRTLRQKVSEIAASEARSESRQGAELIELGLQVYERMQEVRQRAMATAVSEVLNGQG